MMTLGKSEVTFFAERLMVKWEAMREKHRGPGQG
jgi:hypothetical protein